MSGIRGCSWKLNFFFTEFRDFSRNLKIPHFNVSKLWLYILLGIFICICTVIICYVYCCPVKKISSLSLTLTVKKVMNI